MWVMHSKNLLFKVMNIHFPFYSTQFAVTILQLYFLSKLF